ncbi:MAG: hypothetical protein ACK4NY_20375 [Spirosomataceae bacterium]
MKKIAIFSIAVSALAVTYIYFAKKTPFLPGYHAIFYTPKKYQGVVRQVQNNQSPEKLEANFNKLMPYWYGTRWSYNGTTQKPGKGSIACGYFVTTVLQDLGVTLNRSQLAQLPSEQMIKNLVATEDIQRFNNTPIFTFLYQVKQSGKGLYVVGLDTHTGFILNDDKGTWFIHSSGAFPFCVVKQEAAKAKILTDSRYRVLGKLTGSQEFIRKYI